MREIITGRDIGTTVDFRSQGSYEARHPWPAETTVSAGTGVVFIRNAKPGEARSYGTLFMEVYPPGASFIRGEGETPQACEDAAWAKYQLALQCSDQSGTHDSEPRDYRNGAGFCTKCNTFRSKIFTGEQLGQFCKIFGVGTTYDWHTNESTGAQEFLCEEHYADNKPTESTDSNHPLVQLLDALLNENGDDEEGQR